MRKNNEILDPQQTVCDNFHEWIQKEMKQYDPVMVQMTVLGQTLKIIKSIMPAKDYDGMMDTVYQSKDRIEPFKKHLLH
jgi:5,10-methylene-tetrahydrofolate dehydrogenase/methenyl tetrahydrofolate cyclohydrolase